MPIVFLSTPKKETAPKPIKFEQQIHESPHRPQAEIESSPTREGSVASDIEDDNLELKPFAKDIEDSLIEKNEESDASYIVKTADMFDSRSIEGSHQHLSFAAALDNTKYFSRQNKVGDLE